MRNDLHDDSTERVQSKPRPFQLLSRQHVRAISRAAVATVKFLTGYADSNGHGTTALTLRGGFLYWQIVKSEGEHYFPKTARLSRAK